jgi:poly-gamma-glutamate capsule biosynthesis protein CapA/YwtB (metallophosphatase superfamily)
MAVSVALAGDTMLGRGVAARLAADPGHELLAAELVAIAREADLFVVNLECCISDRGERVRDPEQGFFFRAPPVAAERLAELGVACVTLANNHVLDFGRDALLDTLEHLRAAGVAAVGAGPDDAAARTPVVLTGGGLRVRVVAATDHPSAYAAAPGRPGIAFADLLHEGIPEWLRESAVPGPDADVVIVSPHWGPNMRARPVAHVRRAAAALEVTGATLVAGHSAHVPQGPRGRTLFDLGDFIDDYAVDSRLRNDLGLLWLVTLDAGGPLRVEGVPVKLEFAHTRPASHVEATLLLALLEERCEAVGSSVRREGARLVFETGRPSRIA